MEFKIYDRISYQTDTSAQKFATFLQENLKGRDDCVCYYKNPIYYTEANFTPTFVLVDREYGIMVFSTFNYTSDSISFIGENYWETSDGKVPNFIGYFQDYCYTFESDIFRPVNKLKGKLKFNYYTVFPFLDRRQVRIDENLDSDIILFDDYRSTNPFAEIKNVKLNDIDWKRVNSIVQKAHVLNKNTGVKLELPVKNLREAIMLNEQQIAVFDDEQLDAGLHIADGAERIRGLAGTGKTIILAMKAARIHFMHPEHKILYTFYTQSLYNQVKNLISRFYRNITGTEPNWDNLIVMHAWGGKAKAGVYSTACIRNGVIPKALRDIPYSDNPFGDICRILLNHRIKAEYDCVLIDEAQDMPIEFFHLIQRLTTPEKRIVWAYDELQTTGDVRIPDSAELFGYNESGNPLVVLSEEKDFILKRSYRNHRKVLFLAVAFGFGLYNTDGIVQIIDDENNWEALGFSVTKGSFKSLEEMNIERPMVNSPNKIDDYYQKYDILEINSFTNKVEEAECVAQKIIELVIGEKVKPQDIMVIDLGSDPKSVLRYIQGQLYSKDINSIIPGVVDGADDFFIEGNVTLTTVRRAKGNEAPVVFVIGMDNIYNYKNKLRARVLRNMAFISITRAKGWCFITGKGENMERFRDEYNRIMQDFPVYKFTFPSDEEQAQIKTIDYLTKNTGVEKKFQAQVDLLSELLNGDLDVAKVLLTDDLKKKLRGLLGEEG